MLRGLTLAIAANALWATAFVAPVLLPSFTPIEITVGRYAVFGASSVLVLMFIATRGTRPVTAALLRSPQAWLAALVLTALGNVIYYACLSTGLRMAGTAMPTLIVGALPMVMAVLGALGERNVPWGGLGVSLALIGSGLLLVQFGGGQGDAPLVDASDPGYGTGIAFAVAALVSWTVYGLGNARYLQRRSGTDMAAWTCMIGVATLPLLVPLLLLSDWANTWVRFASHKGDELLHFAAVSLVLGIGTSWIATWAWNGASAVLPTRLLGQIIVVETLMALAFAALLRWQWPAAAVVGGAGLLLVGVLVGVRLARTHDRDGIEVSI